MTLWIEIVMWLALGLVAAALVARHRFAVAAVSISSVALAFGSFVRLLRGLGAGSLDIVALFAALSGAWLAALMLRNMDLLRAPASRTPTSRAPVSRT